MSIDLEIHVKDETAMNTDVQVKDKGVSTQEDNCYCINPFLYRCFSLLLGNVVYNACALYTFCVKHRCFQSLLGHISCSSSCPLECSHLCLTLYICVHHSLIFHMHLCAHTLHIVFTLKMFKSYSLSSYQITGFSPV